MKPVLTFDTVTIRVSTLGEESCVPDLRGYTDPQKDLDYVFDDPNEVYSGYGSVGSAYPYRLYDCVEADLTERELKTAVLENDFLRAVFLPELGGRLWELYDKENERNLLYTNDVIKLRNLAIRNAWFSGGVEWNVGFCGHTPFTTDPLFTAKLKDAAGNPVLRMYEYERVREVVYQMDFWLGEEDRFLNARMRIINSGDETVPMYWWSNIAVPEYKGGRVVVPASEAFSSGGFATIPYMNGMDVTFYNDLPVQIDYFYNIPKDEPKYIANVGEDGYGLLQFSTDLLRGRKLFSWGNNEGSNQWQSFLTEKAGHYIETQAGIGKTQGGCVPMPAHTTWEWVEQYGAIRLAPGENRLPFDQLRAKVSEHVRGLKEQVRIEEKLREQKTMAESRAEVVARASGYGAFKNFLRGLENGPSIGEHLDFGEMEAKQRAWVDFMRTGVLHCPSEQDVPEDFVSDAAVYAKLKETENGSNRDNWYAAYQMGLYEFWKGQLEKAKEHLARSLRLTDSAWAHHALARIALLQKEEREAVRQILLGAKKRKGDLAFLKEAFQILLDAKGYRELLTLYEELPDAVGGDPRLRFGWLTALYHAGDAETAYRFLQQHEDYTLDDLRECDTALENLWVNLEIALFGECRGIPERYRFKTLN